MDLVRERLAVALKTRQTCAFLNQYEQNLRTFRDKPKVLNETVPVALEFLTII